MHALAQCHSKLLKERVTDKRSSSPTNSKTYHAMYYHHDARLECELHLTIKAIWAYSILRPSSMSFR